MGKRALLVGISYINCPGKITKLAGCINDVIRMYNCLINRYGFAEEDITVLIDTDPKCPQPTGANIKLALNYLVGSAKPGDCLFFQYSGHGIRLDGETGDDDDTGHDECIVPCDMNLIHDHDFRELVKKVPDGCIMTIVSDSCHSGGLLDKSKEQIGESYIHHYDLHHKEESEEVEEIDHAGGCEKSRSLPLSSLIEILKEKTRKEDVDVGNIKATLFHLFGKDTSPKFKKSVKEIIKRHQEGRLDKDGRGHGGLTSIFRGIAHEKLKIKAEEEDEEVGVESEAEVHAGPTKKNSPDNGVLISGCQSDQTSADWRTPQGAYGACSNAIQTIIEETDGKVTNKDLVLKVRTALAKQGFLQRPGLYCTDKHLNTPFIC